MNSLLAKEGMAGKVQMAYFDPPYGIGYGSNFQPFVDKSDVKDGKDADLTREPEMLTAFRDTWELGIHSYLSYLRDRLLLIKELLSDTGSVFVQISDENLHYVRCILDEVFGRENFVSQIFYQKTTGAGSPGDLKAPPSLGDYILWYAKNEPLKKFRPLFIERGFGDEGSSGYKKIELADGTRMSISEWEKLNGKEFDYESRPEGSRVYLLDNIVNQSGEDNSRFPVQFEGKTYTIDKGSWRTSKEGFQRLIDLRRVAVSNEGLLKYVRYIDDFPYMRLTNLWTDTTSSFGSGFGEFGKRYVVQTNISTIRRCLLMTTDPGDLVLDITCGSGSTAYVAEEWGRRWITCDTSRIAVELARERLMTATFPYYRLLHPNLGVSGGLDCETAEHVTLKSLANDMPAPVEILVDRPKVDKGKVRVSGPFTVEAVLAPVAQRVDRPEQVDASTRQAEWRDELLRTGVMTRAGDRIMFTRVEPLFGTVFLQAEAEALVQGETRRAVVHFAGETHPLDPRTVRNALDEAEKIRPSPDIVVFCAFQFDPFAAKDIDETVWPGMDIIKVAMNADLLTDDLKKKSSKSQSFWIVGQPDVVCERGDDGRYTVTVRGFDYFGVNKDGNGEVTSGKPEDIAMWMLDTDYDGMCLVPSQVFFPMARKKGGWKTLAKNLKAELDPDLMERYRGTVSIPFEVNGRTKIAVKIIDDRGIESMRVMDVGEDE